MREPTLLKCLFVYEDISGYGDYTKRTNKINWKGIKYLLQKLIKWFWKKFIKILEIALQYLIPTLIAYYLFKFNILQIT